MLELIRRYIRKRMVARREMVDKWHHEVGPRVLKIIEKNKQHSVECIAEYCGDLKFEVRTMYHDQFRVDLVGKTCDCNRWNLSGIPCMHAIACMHQRALNPMDFVDDCYKKAAFVKAYSPIVHPMPGPSMWKKSASNPPIPPQEKKLPGRPKKQRRKEPEELHNTNTGTKKLKKNYIVMTCRGCKVQKHNINGCPNVQTRTAPTSQPGQPTSQPTRTPTQQSHQTSQPTTKIQNYK